jgi:hypothetical protein
MDGAVDVGLEIERLVCRRQALLRRLAEAHDPALVGECRLVEQRLSRLWEAKRIASAESRFGKRRDILARARQEQELMHARQRRSRLSVAPN